MNINNKVTSRTCFSLIGVLLLFMGCQKMPTVKDYLSINASFNKRDVYEPILGRIFLQPMEFNGDGSTYPLKFSIENLRGINELSDPSVLLKNNKVKVWARDYTGLEKSLEEIEQKRVWMEKPFLDIREGSGDLIFWKSSSEVINAFPSEGYLFDIKVENKGNEIIYKDFKLRPLREVPYEPYEYDLKTGKRKKEVVQNSNGKSFIVDHVNHPTFMSNIYYDRDSLMSDSLVSVLIYPVGNRKNSLTFSFLDKDGNAINPDKFQPSNYEDQSLGNWKELIHGFNMIKTDNEVSYEVAYPIPLTSIDTKYARKGLSRVKFGYSRKGFGGVRIDAYFGLDFSIYEEGAWNIVFQFKRDLLFDDY